MLSLKRMILLMLCLNLGCWMVASMFPEDAPFTPVLPVTASQVEEELQGLTQRDPLSMVALMAGYVWAMFIMLVNLFGWAVFGFPAFLASVGAPTVISIPLGLLWSVCFLLGVIELLSGRNV